MHDSIYIYHRNLLWLEKISDHEFKMQSILVLCFFLTYLDLFLTLSEQNLIVPSWIKSEDPK